MDAGDGRGGGDGFGSEAGDGEGWVHLLSVTSDNPQFHPASFQPHALPPGGETSFQVSGGGERRREERRKMTVPLRVEWCKCRLRGASVSAATFAATPVRWVDRFVVAPPLLTLH